MKYVIFGLEIIAIIIWLKFFTRSLLPGILGIIVIISISQILHMVLKAR